VAIRFIWLHLACLYVANFLLFLSFHEHRLEVKSANLESENQALRQQAITTPPSTAKSQAACSKISMIHRCQENGHILNGNAAYAEMKSSLGPTETRASMVV